MSIVGIFEDNPYDAIRRYKSLVNEGHEVHVCILDFPEVLQNIKVMRETFQQQNFNPKEVYFDANNMPRNADIYFCDGLMGRCFSVARSFGKDRTVINSGDPSLMREAREAGYKTLETGVFPGEFLKQFSK